ncbi:hypothetical protein [Corynebacterium caspium]|uniref:hypothetical protein n=1 Tax=Corynebacterium caspium TaxID=234828 RepID=UPI000372E0EC|nr:hypothetical protein [Corynebacterium caspium]WKD59005.1 hypothetical protein CCASP_03005 [Corynebacterium caspium DSM 44850]
MTVVLALAAAAFILFIVAVITGNKIAIACMFVILAGAIVKLISTEIKLRKYKQQGKHHATAFPGVVGESLQNDED